MCEDKSCFLFILAVVVVVAAATFVMQRVAETAAVTFADVVAGLIGVVGAVTALLTHPGRRKNK